jgi:hypothetical protein
VIGSDEEFLSLPPRRSPKRSDVRGSAAPVQLAAMSYAAHLARSLAAVESNPRRQQFLQRTDRKFTELHRQVYKMLFTRYQRSG